MGWDEVGWGGMSHRVAEAWLSNASLRLAPLPSHVVHLFHHGRARRDIRQLKDTAERLRSGFLQQTGRKL